MRSGGICCAVVCLLVTGVARADEKPRRKKRPPVLGFEMAIGTAYAYDGLAAGHFGATARVARTVGAERRLAVELGASVPFVLAEVGDTRSEFAIFRVPVWLGVDLTVGEPSPTTRFVLSVRGGPVFYRRSTRTLTNGARPEGEDVQVAGAVGPELRFEVALSRRTGLSIGLSADVLAGAPVVRYAIGPEDDVEEITVGETWFASLGMSLCLVVW